MIDDYTKSLINKYKPKGILVDTNILILWIVGSVNRQRITSFKRTAQFMPKDYDDLVRILTSFSKIVTTPNILTEVSNLVKDIKEPELSKCFNKLAESLSTAASFRLEEYYIESKVVAEVDCFNRFGLTDCSILKLAHDDYLVLTDDFNLARHLLGMGIDVINFNHLRNI